MTRCDLYKFYLLTWKMCMSERTPVIRTASHFFFVFYIFLLKTKQMLVLSAFVLCSIQDLNTCITCTIFVFSSFSFLKIINSCNLFHSSFKLVRSLERCNDEPRAGQRRGSRGVRVNNGRLMNTSRRATQLVILKEKSCPFQTRSKQMNERRSQ